MVKKLRRKFILTAMSALLVILVILIAAINLINLRQRTEQRMRMEERIERGEPLMEGIRPGGFPGGGPPRETRGFMPEDKEGFIRFQREQEMAGTQNLLLISIVIGLVCLLAMFLLVYLFSGRAVAPVVDSLEKQKQFMTDAGHELKTPLSVIKADVDVLEMEGVKNEWTESIRAQADRMNDLVKNMLALSRMEEEFITPHMEQIDLSALVTRTAAGFDAVADTRNRRYKKEIATEIYVKGDARGLEQLVNVLLDNAMKYASGDSEVILRLEKDATAHKVNLEVSNSVDVLPEGSLDRLFDRFYRADTSRNKKTGGFGVGLSAAKAIATAHGGSIRAVTDGDHIIRFLVRIPAQ